MGWVNQNRKFDQSGSRSICCRSVFCRTKCRRSPEVFVDLLEAAQLVLGRKDLQLVKVLGQDVVGPPGKVDGNPEAQLKKYD